MNFATSHGCRVNYYFSRWNHLEITRFLTLPISVTHSRMSKEVGYWTPHTSSVDFCEPNYFLTPYVAEVHNTWSSLLISAIAVIGFLYGHPSGEHRFTFMLLILFTVGIGSFLLHSTLHWFHQSSDEVPMLWENLSFLFTLIEIKSPKGKPKYKYLPALFFGFAILQTAIYYMFQNLYAAFLVTYISAVAVVIYWAGYLAYTTKDEQIRSERLFLFFLSIALFVGVGGIVWIVDMNLCHQLMPFYTTSGLGGITMHVIWHIAAGYACYTMIVLLMLIRMQELAYPVYVRWLGGFFPCCALRDSNTNKNK